MTNLGFKAVSILRTAGRFIFTNHNYWKRFEEFCKWVYCSHLVFADPEVHIPLENLQQFPAFNSYTCSSDSPLGSTSTEGRGALSLSPLSRSPGSQAGKWSWDLESKVDHQP